MFLRNLFDNDADVPGPDGLGFKRMVEMRRDPLVMLSRLVREHGDLFRMRMAGALVYVVRDPELVKDVLQTRNKSFDKGTRGYNVMRRFLGEGLLTAEGESWLRNRRIAQPLFHKRRIAGFASIMSDQTTASLNAWEQRSERGDDVLDVDAEMMALTMRIVVGTLFGNDLGVPVDLVARSMDAFQHYTVYASMSLLGQLPQLPTRKQRELNASAAEIDALIYRFIEERRSGRHTGTGDDLLSMLMDARDEETGAAMDDKQLRDETLTMFLAGHETTANSLIWTLSLLSSHPEVRRRLEAEVDSVLEGRVPASADVRALPYTEKVIKESMRLFPPAWTVARRSVEDTEIGGYPVPRGSFVILSPYLMHRHPELWENPLGFDPDRWDTEAVKNLPRFAYFPFGGGPRLCIGKPFAMMEAVLILAMITQRYRLDREPGYPLEPEALITLRPKNGLKMRLIRR